MKWNNDNTEFEIDGILIKPDSEITVNVRWFLNHRDLMIKLPESIEAKHDGGWVPVVDWTLSGTFELGFNDELFKLHGYNLIRFTTGQFYRYGDEVIPFI